MTLGNFATKLLLDTKAGITKLRGQEFPYRDGTAVLVPTLHPAAVLRSGGTALAQARADFVVAKRALARASKVMSGSSAVTHSAEETRALGRSIGALLRRRRRRAARRRSRRGEDRAGEGHRRGPRRGGPGREPDVHARTTYAGRVPLLHVDVYRLDRVQELLDLGFEEDLDDAVTVVEWGDIAAAYLPLSASRSASIAVPRTTTGTSP